MGVGASRRAKSKVAVASAGLGITDGGLRGVPNTTTISPATLPAFSGHWSPLLSNREVFQTGVPVPNIARHPLKAVVASIASDKAVRDSIMKNEAVVDYFQSHNKTDKDEELHLDSDDESGMSSFVGSTLVGLAVLVLIVVVLKRD